jgi:hypothetical protein
MLLYGSMPNVKRIEDIIRKERKKKMRRRWKTMRRNVNFVCSISQKTLSLRDIEWNT